jgi:hypothetical protein
METFGCLGDDPHEQAEEMILSRDPDARTIASDPYVPQTVSSVISNAIRYLFPHGDLSNA